MDNKAVNVTVRANEVVRVTLGSGKVVTMVGGAVENRIAHALGEPTIQRASHIWPADWLHRMAFLVIRRLFNDESPLVEWAKRWKVVWTVRWAEQPDAVVFSSSSRRECRRWERQQLFRRLREANGIKR
jgi:hypothetical protein